MSWQDTYDPDDYEWIGRPGTPLPVPGMEMVPDEAPPPATLAADDQDAPQPGLPAVDDSDLSGSDQPGPPVETGPVSLARPIPVMPGPGRIIYASSLTYPAGTGPVLLGLDPSRTQRATIAYTLVSVGTEDGVIGIAGTPDAMPGMRYPVYAAPAPPLRLDHVAGVWAWVPAGGSPVTVSVLVVGAR